MWRVPHKKFSSSRPMLPRKFTITTWSARETGISVCTWTGSSGTSHSPIGIMPLGCTRELFTLMAYGLHRMRHTLMCKVSWRSIKTWNCKRARVRERDTIEAGTLLLIQRSKVPTTFPSSLNSKPVAHSTQTRSLSMRPTLTYHTRIKKQEK